jgi:hypothetical protein
VLARVERRRTSRRGSPTTGRASTRASWTHCSNGSTAPAPRAGVVRHRDWGFRSLAGCWPQPAQGVG